MSSIGCDSLKKNSVFEEDKPHSGLWSNTAQRCIPIHRCTVERGMIFDVFERASVPWCFSLSVSRFFVLREHYVIVFGRNFVKTYQILIRVVKLFSKVSH